MPWFHRMTKVGKDPQGYQAHPSNPPGPTKPYHEMPHLLISSTLPGNGERERNFFTTHFLVKKGIKMRLAWHELAVVDVH